MIYTFMFSYNQYLFGGIIHESFLHTVNLLLNEGHIIKSIKTKVK